jgi:Tol biopolymer transport system component
MLTRWHMSAIYRSAIWSCILGAAAIAAGVVRAGDLADELKALPYKIVYESWQNDNWEIMMVNADGSQSVNLTKTPKVNELYPHVSPDGKKVVFSVDDGDGDASTVRSIWTMNLDGTDRTRVAENARDACWNGDGTAIAYLPDESKKFNYIDYATKGVMIYDLKTKEQRPHPNKDLYHLYNICWASDGRWFVSTVHAGMGFGHAILAFPADDSQKVFSLKLPGCRPDLSPDGKKICWGASDYVICAADLDLSGPEPKVTNVRDVAKSIKPEKIYHADWSPDGRYIAFAIGPTQKKLGRMCEVVGVKAPGWNIGVADANAKDRKLVITHDGASSKRQRPKAGHHARRRQQQRARLGAGGGKMRAEWGEGRGETTRSARVSRPRR